MTLLDLLKVQSVLRKLRIAFILPILIISIPGFCVSACSGLGEMYYDLLSIVPICVDYANGSDANDGRGWDNAVKTITQAAALVNDGGEIWINKNPGTITAAAVISKSNVGIYGGFSGAESRREERNASIRSPMTGSLSTGSLITFSGGTQKMIIDGLEFSGITNTGGQIITIGSGGTGAEVLIRNCSFVSNTVYSHAVFSNTGSSLDVTGCSFLQNTSTDSTTGSGSAISASNSTVTIEYSVFSGNTSAGSGGAVYANTGGSMTVSNSEIRSNKALNNMGGGLCTENGLPLNITNCSIESNNVTSTNAYGGGVYCDGTLTISNSTVASNFASSSAAGNAFGGGIYKITGSAAFSNTTFSSNYSSSTGSGAGGALYSTNTAVTISGSAFSLNSTTANGGALWIGGTSALDISHSDFVNNMADESGGAMFLTDTSTTVISHSNIESNKAMTLFGGGILMSSTAYATITDSIISKNSSVAFYGGAFQVSSGGSGQPTLNINRCTVTSNKSASYGGMLFNQGFFNASNTLFANNRCGSTNSGEEVDNELNGSYSFKNCTIINNGTKPVIYSLSTTPGTDVISNCIIYGTSGMTFSIAPTVSHSVSNMFASGFLTLLPIPSEFVNFSSGDYHLTSTSQFINAGDNASVYGSYDLDNTARIKGGTVDIGCYEKK